MAVTETILTKIKAFSCQFFASNSNTKFRDNPVSGLAADIRSQTDVLCLHIDLKHSLLF